MNKIQIEIMPLRIKPLKWQTMGEPVADHETADKVIEQQKWLDSRPPIGHYQYRKVEVRSVIVALYSGPETLSPLLFMVEPEHWDDKLPGWRLIDANGTYNPSTHVVTWHDNAKTADCSGCMGPA